MYYRRDAEQTLLKLSKTYPVVAIVGPRQSGKTTMTQALFKEKKYISLVFKFFTICHRRDHKNIEILST